MRMIVPLLFCLGLSGAEAATAGDVTLRVWDLDGSAARVGAPVFVEIDARDLFGKEEPPPNLYLLEIDGAPDAGTPLVSVQFEPHVPGVRPARLWWLMPEGQAGERRFGLSAGREGPGPGLGNHYDWDRRQVNVLEGSTRVLRYNHGSVPVPEGTHPHFAAGESYERGDYIHPLYGPHGEELTEDYPKDHPHHRGVWWSWPVTRWKDRVADIWAVVGVWSRPADVPCRWTVGRVCATVEADNVWKFGKQEYPIVRERVLIRAFPERDGCRFLDVEVQLTALADDVAIGGRPKAGYGGFSLRAAPCEDRKITLHLDPEGSDPRRSWIDYSGLFTGGQGKSGVAIFEHVTNPDYPNPLHEYPGCNCVMPAYPEMREVVLSKDEPLVLKHRLWVHPGGPDQSKLADVWTAYAKPPKVTIEKQ
ncbi:MAG TPA: DUF6807 family protein [Thermoguttaceae bacterium]|nr:DUF6807 family protein [Thermoguttaceae bacterium]